MNQYNFLITYDIFNDKRRRKIQKSVYSYSIEGQKSSRETAVTRSMLVGLVQILREFSSKEDKINIIKCIQDPICLGKDNHTDTTTNGIIVL